mgnify:CR=1 FL=1
MTGQQFAIFDTPIGACGVIWGERDSALLLGILDGLDGHVDDLRIERIADASHWVVHERGQRVNDLIDAFLAG